jgi:large repetitive protein
MNPKIHQRLEIGMFISCLLISFLGISNYHFISDNEENNPEIVVHPDEYYFNLLDEIINKPMPADDVVVLNYSTFIYKTSITDYCAITVDNLGCAYITGMTSDTDFPITLGAFNETHSGSNDVFVCKINANGSALVYSTFIGPATNGVDIMVDSSGCAYITGTTYSSNFPTTTNAIEEYKSFGSDVFVSKLNANGSDLEYSTYLGGFENDVSNSISVDLFGCAFITGYTLSDNYQNTTGVINETKNGEKDIFVSKINPNGTILLYSTYLGGSNDDCGQGVVVDSDGCAYITGYTKSDDFPSTSGAFNNEYSENIDVFVCKLNVDCSALVYSTYIGPAGYTFENKIAVDNSGCAFITGSTTSSDFPSTFGAYDETFNGGNEAYICKINDIGSTLEYSTFVGGSSNDRGHDIVVDSYGCAYITGYTESSNFPITYGAIKSEYDSSDMIICRINDDGSILKYSTLLGGTSTEKGHSIAIDNTGATYIIGYTRSTDYPTTSGVFSENYITTYDNNIVVSKIENLAKNVPNASFSANTTNIIQGGEIQFMYTGLKGNEPSNLQWNFGDGTGNFTDENPIHKFSSSGNFKIILTITDLGHVISSKTMMVTIIEELNPLVRFETNSTNIIVGQSINFTFNGSKGNEPTTYLWDFGDGSENITEINSIHQFTKAGNYTVSLTIKDVDGDNSYGFALITVKEKTVDETIDKISSNGTTSSGNDENNIHGYPLGFLIGFIAIEMIFIMYLKKKKLRNNAHII